MTPRDRRRRLRLVNDHGFLPHDVLAILQRFGAALNINIHVHALVLDGVFADDGGGKLRFHPAAGPTEVEMARALDTTVRRIKRVLVRRGIGGDEGDDDAVDRWRDEAPVLAGLAAASVVGQAALRPRVGARTRRCGRFADVPPRPRPEGGPCQAQWDGFDLHAGVVVPGRDRARLERVCRYARRSPVAHDRIRLTTSGDVLLELRHRWADGTSHLLFDPVKLLERLAALTPRPRINLLLYYGVLGVRSVWRSRLRAREPDTPATKRRGATQGETTHDAGPIAPRANRLWAELMQRSFGFDVLACPRCGGRLELVALIEDPRVIQRILRHLGLPIEVPAARPARPPPLPLRRGEPWYDADG